MKIYERLFLVPLVFFTVGWGYPLHKAIQKGSQEKIDKALAKVKDIDRLDKKGRTPLYYAVVKKDRALIDRIIEKGAKLDLEMGGGKRVVAKAIEMKDDGLVDYLLEKGADLDYAVFFTIRTSDTPQAKRLLETVATAVMKKISHLHHCPKTLI